MMFIHFLLYSVVWNAVYLEGFSVYKSYYNYNDIFFLSDM